MSEPTRTPAEVIADVLRAEGEIHSWRCDYPAQYGPCTCFADFAGLIVEALVEAGAAMSELDLAAIRIKSGLVLDGMWCPEIEDEFRSWAIVLASDARDLLAEVERLTRIVDGYDRTPAEQRAADAEAEVDRLRAEVENLRGGHEVYYPLAMRTLTAEAESEQLRAENAALRKAVDIAILAHGELTMDSWDDEETRLRVIATLNQLAGYELANAAGEASAAPVAANGPGLALGDTPHADDAGEGQS